MADRLEWFDVTISPNTPMAAPVVIPCVFEQGIVTEIDVKVPPGPNGNVGFFIGAGGSQYVPRTAGSFVMPNNDYFVWPIDNAIISGSWSVTAYNIDVFPHTIQVAFQIDEIGTAHLVPAPTVSDSSSSIPDSVTSPDVSQVPAIDPLSADFLIASLPADAESELV